MTRTTRRLTVIGALLAFAVVGEIVREQYAPITEQYARKAAEAQFEKLCRDFHLQPPDYEPPVPTDVGGADYAFEWKSKRPGVQSVLISVARGDVVEPTWVDDTK